MPFRTTAGVATPPTRGQVAHGLELKKIGSPGRHVLEWTGAAGFPDSRCVYSACRGLGSFDYLTKGYRRQGFLEPRRLHSSITTTFWCRACRATPAPSLRRLPLRAEPGKRLVESTTERLQGKGPILPSVATVSDATYQPLSRPIFVYVAKSAAARPEVKAFMSFYLKQGAALVKEAGYVPLPARAYELAHARLERGVVGSLFSGKGSQVGVTVEDLLARE